MWPSPSTTSMRRSRYYAETFGAKVTHRERIETDGVEEALLKVADSYIQLLTPVRDDSPVAKFLETKGEGLHHVGYRVDDCAEALQSVVDHGGRVIDQAPRPGSRGTTVAFVHPKGAFGTLIELVAGVGDGIDGQRHRCVRGPPGAARRRRLPADRRPGKGRPGGTARPARPGAVGPGFRRRVVARRPAPTEAHASRPARPVRPGPGQVVDPGGPDRHLRSGATGAASLPADRPSGSDGRGPDGPRARPADPVGSPDPDGPDPYAMAFPPGVSTKLESYVYLLVDPWTGQPFFVGRARGDRCFRHLRAARTGTDDSASEATTGTRGHRVKYPMLDHIRTIEAEGRPVRVDILRYGMTAGEARLVEAAANDALGLASAHQVGKPAPARVRTGCAVGEAGQVQT